MDHLPECPAPLCDYFDPKGKCMGYEDCEHLCCCAALRACEQRVLDAAFEAVERVASLRQHSFGWTTSDYWQSLGPALDAIDVLRETNVNT